MTVVLLLCLLALVSTWGAWSTRRHRQIVAWDRELDAAFGPGERRDLPRHRVL